MEFLSREFVMDHVNNNPMPLTELGGFVYSRTYSRWLEDQGRREFWHETVKRALEYNFALEYSHMKDIGFEPNVKRMKEEAKELFENIYNTKQFPSGRTLWLGNGNEKINKDFVLGNFNCSFTNIEKWDDLAEVFYLLMVGTGIGIKSTKEMASKMPKIRTNVDLINDEYTPVLVDKRLEDTEMRVLKNGYAKIYVGDSKEGWVDALDTYLKILTQEQYENIHTISVSYDSVRPQGERLKTFGGTASGPEPLMEMFEGFDNTLKNKIDPTLDPIETDDKGYGQVRPVHLLDMANLIGANVVVGGVRRTAEIFLFDADDYETMFAKYGINGIWTEDQYKHHLNVGQKLDELGIKPVWFEDFTTHTRAKLDKMKIENELYGKLSNAKSEQEREEIQEELAKVAELTLPANPRVGLDHRRMSNNSIAFVEKPDETFMDMVFEMMQLEGEPGFVNLAEGARRILESLGIEDPTEEQIKDKAYQIGLNPCVEIILNSKNVCNLTTINVTAFVNEDGTLDKEGLVRAQELSARIGLRMTLATLELPEWDKTQSRDRLLGASLTGWKDAMGLLNYNQEQEDELKKLLFETARNEADKYSRQLRVNAPMFVTAVKPEGTLSQVAGGVSSGLHWAHSPYFYRRVRITSTDPLAKVAQELGWPIHAEVGTNGFMDENELAKEEQLEAARTWVITFPVKSGAEVTKDDVSVDDQFDNYYSFQEMYTEMNTSNTITVKPGEWKQAQKRVWDNWDNFVGVSFLSHDGGTYQLAPYEAITKEQYEKAKKAMKAFDEKLLIKYESSETELDEENIEECANGVCPIR